MTTQKCRLRVVDLTTNIITSVGGLGPGCQLSGSAWTSYGDNVPMSSAAMRQTATLTGDKNDVYIDGV